MTKRSECKECIPLRDKKNPLSQKSMVLLSTQNTISRHAFFFRLMGYVLKCMPFLFSASRLFLPPLPKICQVS